MDTDTPPTPDPRRWIAFAVVLAAGFMDLLDVTIVNVAIPSIQQDLGAGYAQIEWIIAAYVLSFAAVLITGGRLGDIYGRKRLFLFGIAGFTIASLACGISSSPAMLIGSRFVQGAMAGLMVPQILATIRATFPEDERPKAIALYSGVGGSASAVGLALGGLLVQSNLAGLDWRPIFLVNVPVGILALIAAAAVMRDSRSAHAPRLDPIGMTTAVTAALLLVYPLTEGRRLHWPAWTFVMIGGAVALYALFGLYELRRTRTTGSPLVDVTLFRSRPFLIGMVSWMLFWIAFGGFFLIWTLFMQAGLGWSPMRAGLTAVFFAVGAGIGATVSVSAAAPRLGRWVLIAATVVIAIGFGVYGWMATHYEAGFTSWQMVLPLIGIGIGFGAVVAPTIDMLLGQIPERDAGAASGLLNTGQQLGMALGVALVGILFFAHLDHDSARGVNAVTAQTRTELAAKGPPEPAQDRILAGFRACVQDRSAQVDPTVEPAVCHSAAATDPGVGAILAHAGEHANAVNFAHAFRHTLGWGIGAMAVVCLGFLALPRDARPVPHHDADAPDLVGV